MIPEPLAHCSILIVDDEEANLDLLEGLLYSEGYRRITRVLDARRVVERWESCRPDLVLLDLHMPHRSGFEILADLRDRTARDDFLPVLVLTADVTQEARDRALSEGARDFLTKPFDAVEVLLRVRNLLEIKLLHRSQREGRIHAEAAERRATLLADASRMLSASLDSQTALAQVANLLVRDYADACGFFLLDDEKPRAVAHAALGGTVRLPEEAESALAEHIVATVEERAVRIVPVGAEALIVAPIITPSRPVGALALTIPDPAAINVADLEMISDLASRAALAMDNAELFADAQLASQARERLLSVVAHDLRSPLTAIGMYAEMLLGLLPPASDRFTKDALGSIHRSSQRMQQQIEDLLDLTRLQQGTFSLRRTACALADIFREADLLLKPLADSRAVELRVEGDEEQGSTIAEIDGSRFQQVVSNLVGNALKFTPENGSVLLRWEVDDGDLRVAVADTGPGIAREQIPHIFGAFWQARDGDRRGVGLGLWIARAIVEAHDGRIWVDSAEGEGATFHFAIPIARQHRGADGSVGRMTHASLPLPS
jgi:signal transduction histidine kinase/DNA-binding response OmpR family regulator